MKVVQKYLILIFKEVWIFFFSHIAYYWKSMHEVIENCKIGLKKIGVEKLTKVKFLIVNSFNFAEISKGLNV